MTIPVYEDNVGDDVLISLTITQEVDTVTEPYPLTGLSLALHLSWSTGTAVLEDWVTVDDAEGGLCSFILPSDQPYDSVELEVRLVATFVDSVNGITFTDPISGTAEFNDTLAHFKVARI